MYFVGVLRSQEETRILFVIFLLSNPPLPIHFPPFSCALIHCTASASSLFLMKDRWNGESNMVRHALTECSSNTEGTNPFRISPMKWQSNYRTKRPSWVKTTRLKCSRLVWPISLLASCINHPPWRDCFPTTWHTSVSACTWERTGEPAYNHIMG